MDVIMQECDTILNIPGVFASDSKHKIASTFSGEGNTYMEQRFCLFRQCCENSCRQLAQWQRCDFYKAGLNKWGLHVQINA
ncbi:hypothetical protein AVEN_203648-1 [Araneus ventricosus]|uniref:Uncharacterized protein n=1 Tax=Araneus ventricosus TaxID=182803 RepID=A0A4Y2JAH9_ARAVE|nr:hypothetical protein AVEN_203648-1 [Araneus ventricosus]